MVEGFDHLPSAASEYHHAYYKDHLIKLGYEKEIDWVEFRLFLEGIPEKAKRGAQIVMKRSELSVKSFRKSSELQAYGPQLFEILNESFKELFSVVHLDEEMIKYYINRYLMLLNPEFVKLVFDKDRKFNCIYCWFTIII